MIKHFKVTVSGNVQGVFFRKYTADTAKSLSLKGFVRNDPDGNVYCEVEGEEEVLKRFVKWCQRGSPLSNVTEVVIEEGAVKEFSGFEIKKQ
jgi:acylphosphatase